MCWNFLSTIDLIGIPVAMNLLGREKIKTRFGGVCSILFFGFVAWAVYNTGQELFSTLNPKIVSYEFYKDDPRAITLTRESFPMGFAMLAPDTLNYLAYKDASIFTIQVSHTMMRRTYDNNEQPQEEWTISKIYTEDCPVDYFGDQASSLSGVDLNALYCIAKEQPELDKLEIQGVFSSPVYQAIAVEIYACDNSTSGGTCAPQEKIDEYLTGGWFNVVYVNMVVNPQNYTNPNNTYKDIYYTMLSPVNYRETEIDLGYVEVATDAGWFTESIHRKTYTKVNKIAEFLHTTSHPGGLLMHCTFKVSQLETYYTRTYKKVQGVLAEAGGLANAALVLMVIITAPFMKFKYRESLMNELFEVRVAKKSSNKRKDNKDSYKLRKNKQELQGETNSKEQSLETKQVALANLKSQDIISLNSSLESRAPVTTAHGKSPISFQRLILPDFEEERGKSIFCTSPKQTPVHRKSSENKKTVPKKNRWAHNRPNLKQKEPVKIGQEISGHEGEGRENTMDHKDVKDYQGSFVRLQTLKTELNNTPKMGKSIITNKAPMLKIKSLRDEHSLHLSFSSNTSESDVEIEENTKQTKTIMAENLMNEKQNNLEAAEVTDLETVKQLTNNLRIQSNPSNNEEANDTFESVTREKMDISIWEYISWFLWTPKPFRKRKEAFEEGIKRINERLDIANVMRKLREVDKLRTLLLDQDQLILFNNIPKPAIHLDDSKIQKKSVKPLMSLQSTRFVSEDLSEEQIIHSLANVKCKAQKTAIDLKLIEIFERKFS